jgi:hypothetical protein
MGNDVVVAIKAKMKPLGSETQLIDAINRTEKAFRQQFPQVRWSFFEPDNRD